MHRRDRTTDTELTFVEQHGQYAIHEIQELDGVIPSFPAYGLIIRGHTMLIVGADPDTGERGLTDLDLRFDSPAAVDDIGIDLLRNQYVMIPLNGIAVLEDVTGHDYTSTRRIENPLTQSIPFRDSTVTIPHAPKQPA